MEIIQQEKENYENSTVSIIHSVEKRKSPPRTKQGIKGIQVRNEEIKTFCKISYIWKSSPPKKKSARKLDPIQKVQSKMSKDHKHLRHDFYDVYSPENKLQDIMEK